MHNEDNREEPISKTSVTFGHEYNRNETKQSHGGIQPNEANIYMSNYPKKSQTPLSAGDAQIIRKGPVATSTKQVAGYFTVSGIENELSIPEHDWPCFALKELSG